jgi:hypothetical protein
MNAHASKTMPLMQHARHVSATSMPPVCQVCGSESFAEACPRLIVKLADFRAQVGDDGLELRARLEELRAFGDRC